MPEPTATDFVIGVDTHRDTHTAAIVDASGGVRTTSVIAADSAGYGRLSAFAAEHAAGRRLFAIEGAGAFGAGLATFLAERGEDVIEAGRPKRTRDGSKSDQIDAIKAARQGSPATPARARERAGNARRSGFC